MILTPSARKSRTKTAWPLNWRLGEPWYFSCLPGMKLQTLRSTRHCVDENVSDKPRFDLGLFMIGGLVLVYLCYGLAHPVKLKARSQRFTGINAAPCVVMNFALSNTPGATAEFPTLTKR